jgi:probable rRNA maturation factor
LNRTFRRKNNPTDVLSFPTPNQKASGHSGDIAISAEIAIDNAKRYGHSPADEVKILILHGMLHLAGHDHETDQGKMARIETKLRRQLGLADSLISRTHAVSKGEANQSKKRASRPQTGKMKATKTAASPRRKAARRRTLLTK